jgi:hypothetical protein
VVSHPDTIRGVNRPAASGRGRLRTPDDALAALEIARVMTLVACDPLSSLVVGVTGESIRGSWWGHPKGKLIFRLASALEEHPDVLVVKLARGKVTFIHRVLWPVLLRVVTDKGWRRAGRARLSGEARALFASVERKGRVALSQVHPPPTVATKQALEKSLLVIASQVHTEQGKHATVLTSWEQWATSARAAPASGSLKEARAEVSAACHGLETL